jgi:hypothetical protein
MSRLVRPETVVLTLSGGDTLVVKRRLNYGESVALYEASGTMNGDGTRHVDRVKAMRAAVVAYLVDWAGPGFTDFEGRPLVVRDQPPEVVAALLDKLDPDDVLEIRAAVTTHENTQAAARLEEKKRLAGETAS